MARIDELERGLVDQYGIQVKATLTEDGKELGDPTPVAPPAHLRRGMTTAEQIQQMVRRELSLRAEASGFESFEESDDFDVDDDPVDPHTPYEAVFDPPPPLKEKENGDASSDKGRSGPVEGRSGKSGKVGKGEPGAGKSAADQAGLREADFGDPSSEGED